MWIATSPEPFPADPSSSMSASITSSSSSAHTHAMMTDTPESIFKKSTAVSLSPLSSTLTASRPRDLSHALEGMIEDEGAGTWPPSPTYAESWPEALIPYHQIAMMAPPYFVDSSQLHPHKCEEELEERIIRNRQWLTSQLQDAIPQESLDLIMNNLLPSLTTPQRLGFHACLAYLTHLYRWGTLPVVKLAQEETELSRMPLELRRPFEWCNRKVGLRTSGGCLYTMTLLNVSPTIVYSNIRHLADKFPDAYDAERQNAQIFYEMERLALPFYQAIAALAETTNTDEAGPLLDQANASLKSAFKLFADTVKEGRIKKDVWMSHAQGFHGWGVDDFDGVSGDHSLLIRTLDAFLDIPIHTAAKVENVDQNASDESQVEAQLSSDTPSQRLGWRAWFWSFTPWGTQPPSPAPSQSTTPSSSASLKSSEHPEFTEVPYSNDYLPSRQVEWIQAVRASGLRQKLNDRPELAETIRHLKLWRLGHTRKAVYYENLELPERKPMTASGGVGGGVGGEGVGEMIKRLELRLRARVEATK